MSIVPILQGRNIINKTIVYSDTVLNLKELGKNLQVTTIDSIGESELNSCLQTIFENNPNVLFNTIQYSKKNKKIYFYTNSLISTEKWDDKKIRRYELFSKSKEILEEIKNILQMEINQDEKMVSLYDISILLSQRQKNLDLLKERFKYKFDGKIHNHFGLDGRIVIYNFDYKEHELSIGFKYISSEYRKMTFTKINDDLYLKKSEEYLYKDKIFTLLAPILSELYDEFIKYEDFINQSVNKLKAINTSFFVDINRYGVELFVPTDNVFENSFSIMFRGESNKYDCKCNSSNVISVINNQENEIFKRVFIEIKSCPKWMQEELLVSRKNQLEKEKNEIILKKIEEEKRAKRMMLIKKIFPFIKNK